MTEMFRSTGAQCPWSFYQILSYIIYICSTVVLFVQILPSFQPKIQISLTVLYSLIFLLVIYYLSKLTCSNPTDPLVLQFKAAESEVCELFRLKQDIENKASRYCNYCRSPVTCSRSKHCMRCNRCVSIFDHHCKFVNNCVGRSNYNLFIKLILSLEVFELIFLVSSSLFIFKEIPILSPFHIPSFFLLAKSLAVTGSNGYLISFHFFISRRNLTTYEYITEKLKKKGEITPEGRSPANPKDDQSFALQEDRSEL